MKTRFQEDRLVMIQFFKIRRVYDHFKAKFNDLYNPGENIPIDEYDSLERESLISCVYGRQTQQVWCEALHAL